MDGYAATQYIREKLGLKIPIIAMTARALQGEKEKCINNGMDGYISKPINDTELFEILSGYMAISPGKKDNIPTTVTSKYIYINLAYIKEISNGSIAYEKVVTGQFIESIPPALSNMMTAYQNKDFKEINSIAHHMQTSIAIMGLLSKCGSLLDILEFAGPNDDDIASVIDRLVTICENAVAEARDFHSSLS
jgi:CheY-like chemotaxis protein